MKRFFSSHSEYYMLDVGLDLLNKPSKSRSTGRYLARYYDSDLCPPSHADNEVFRGLNTTSPDR